MFLRSYIDQNLLNLIRMCQFFFGIGSFKNSSIIETVKSGILLCSIPVVTSPIYAPCIPGSIESRAHSNSRASMNGNVILRHPPS